MASSRVVSKVRKTRALAFWLGVAALLSAGLAPVHAAPSQALDFGRRALAPKVHPTDTVVADLDADGSADVVTAVGLADEGMESTRGLSVMLGDGGRMRPARLYRLPSLVENLQVIDVTGDGVLDVVAVTQSTVTTPSGRVFLLPGEGDGTLAPSTALFPARVKDAVLGRFDPGPQLDAAVIGTTGLQLLPGTGPLQFGEPIDLNLPGALGVWSADLDADGLDELLVGEGPTLRRVQDGQVVATVTLPDRISDVAFADMAGDSRLEILVASKDGTVLVADSDLAVLRQEFSSTGANAVAAGDVTGDGIPDVVITGRAADITVDDGTTVTTVTLRRTATDLEIADVTGDRHSDILAVEPTPSVIEVLADPLGADRAAPTVAPTFSGGYDTHVVDIDADGDDDMVAANCWTFLGDTGNVFRAEVFRNDGTGGFSRSDTLTATLPSSCGTDVGDVNGDGAIDVLMTDYYSGSVHQWLGDGAGSFLPAVVTPACYFALDVVVADYNADGTDDAVVLCGTPSAITVMAGTPAGLVRTPLTLPYGFGAGTYLSDTGDVNGDGHLDLVLGSVNDTCATMFCVTEAPAAGRPVTYFLGGGNLTFDTMRETVPSSTFYTLAVADVDEDGYDDVLTPLVSEDLVQVHHGAANGSLARTTVFASYDYPWGLDTRDVDGDSHVDLVMSHGPNIVSVTKGFGDGTFATPTGFATARPTGDVFTGMLDADDAPDILVVEAEQAEILLQR